MTEVHQALGASDPVHDSKLAALSSSPAFDELFEEIVAGRGSVTEAVEPARKGSVHRRVAFVPVLAAAAVTLVVTLVATSTGRTPGRAHTPAASHSGATWRLVSDISPSWHTVQGPVSEQGVSLTCPATSTCYAENVGSLFVRRVSVIQVTQDGGNTWQQSNLPVTLTDPSGLACADASTCSLLGLDGSGNPTFVKTDDGGDTWSVLAGPSGLTSSFHDPALVCATASSCVAIASEVNHVGGRALSFVTGDGGNTWSTSSLPSDFSVVGLQCPSTENCVTSGYYMSQDLSGPPPGAVLYSTDGGSTWATASTPSGLDPIGHLSCGDSSDCLVIASGGNDSSVQVLTSRDAGATWTGASGSGLPGGFMASLSCPDGSDCSTSGMSGVTIQWGGSSKPAAGHTRPASSGQNTYIATTSDGGQSFQVIQPPAGVDHVFDVTCTSATSCYAIGVHGDFAQGGLTYVLLASGS